MIFSDEHLRMVEILQSPSGKQKKTEKTGGWGKMKNKNLYLLTTIIKGKKNTLEE